MHISQTPPSPQPTPQQAIPVWQLLRRGVRDTLPLLPGTVPFGLVYGIAARAAHIPAWLTQAMSFIVFAGSAQFAVVTLVAAGAPVAVLVLTAAILNVRHLLYSASIAPPLRQAGRGWHVVLAYLLTDETYGTVIGRLAALAPAERTWYTLGAGLTLWIDWQLSTLAGLLVGAQIPPAWSLDFAATLTFIALLVPLLTDSSLVWAAVAAGLVAALTVGAPLKLGIVAAALAGVAAGVAADALRQRRSTNATLPIEGAMSAEGEVAAEPATREE